MTQKWMLGLAMALILGMVLSGEASALSCDNDGAGCLITLLERYGDGLSEVPGEDNAWMVW